MILTLIVGSAVSVSASNMSESQMKYYTNLPTCTPGKFPLGALGDYYIYGVKNNKCHIKESLGGIDINCYLPASIARQYAQEGKRVLKESMSTNKASYSEYINIITNDRTYCSVQ